MRSLVNEYNALNAEGTEVRDRIEKVLAPLVKELLSEGQYSAREVAGILLQTADGLIAVTALKRSLEMTRKRRADARLTMRGHRGRDGGLV